MIESEPRGALKRARIDFAPTKCQPGRWRLALATALAIGLSLGADVGLVHAGIALFPSTRGFSHFRFSDYATLTCIGVIVASVGWPLVIRISSSPRWLFLRGAVVVTVMLWLPDVWLFAKGETGRGVAVLAVMHLAIALITYNALVRLAPARDRDTRSSAATQRAEQPPALRDTIRAWCIAMLVMVATEFVLGVLTIVFVPISRPTGWIPAKGEPVFVLHGIVGISALLGACALVSLSRRGGKVARVASIGGVLGITLGAAGGLLAVDHGLRLAGMGVMFVASVIAFFAYIVPLIEPADAAKQVEVQAEKEVSDTGDNPALT